MTMAADTTAFIELACTGTTIAASLLNFKHRIDNDDHNQCNRRTSVDRQLHICG